MFQEGYQDRFLESQNSQNLLILFMKWYNFWSNNPLLKTVSMSSRNLLKMKNKFRRRNSNIHTKHWRRRHEAWRLTRHLVKHWRCHWRLKKKKKNIDIRMKLWGFWLQTLIIFENWFCQMFVGWKMWASELSKFLLKGPRKSWCSLNIQVVA